MPSSFCGVTGLMPTQDRRTGKGRLGDDTVSSAGPIAASIADVALMYAVTANAGE